MTDNQKGLLERLRRGESPWVSPRTAPPKRARENHLQRLWRLFLDRLGL